MPADPAIRVLIADDQLLFAEALAGALSLDHRIEVVGIAANGKEAVHLSGLLQPDVILMDLRMPLMDGVEATRRIVGGDLPAPRILVLTGSDNGEELKAAREAGASGYMTKDQSTLELTQTLTSLVSLAAAFNVGDQPAA
jgi:DNA-binding NarL/FixJ family response regulator